MDSVILPTEIEFYVETMQPHDLETVGSRAWLEWHQRLQKLNQEALLEATNFREEYVKESLVGYNKVSVLLHEAISIHIWKSKVLPHLMKLEPYPESSMVAYSVLYHEVVCVALLELVTYHPSCCESLQDSALDLLDYTYGLASQLLSVKFKEPTLKENTCNELHRQRNNLTFDLGIRALTIIRYLSECLGTLPLSISNQMYKGYDVPMLFMEILFLRPWIKEGKQYSSGAWKDWDGEALCNPEAQLWLALRQLLLDPICQESYHITDTRKNQMLKLLPRMTPTLLDQLAPLMELNHWLNQISIMKLSDPPSKPILLEPVLEVKEKILKETGKKWKSIAQKQLPNIFCCDKSTLIETAKLLNEAYNVDLLEKLEPSEGNEVCGQCGKGAVQRCSKCKNAWYCSRKCQVMNWSTHKEKCVA